jgi:hypothetical protein
MHAQLKAFACRKSEIFRLNARQFRTGLKKLRDEGLKVELDTPVDQLPKLKVRIAWRLPVKGAPERGTSWLADAVQPCRNAVN